MIDYRDATPADWAALDGMAQASWMETFSHSCSAEDLALYLGEAFGPTGRLRQDLGDPSVRFRLALDGDMVAGFAKLTAASLEEVEHGPHDRQLAQLYVLSLWQGSGVAPALMDWTIATARADGAEALFLTVWEENRRALRFYGRYGFVHVGDHDFPVGNQIDRDLIMRLTLS